MHLIILVKPSITLEINFGNGPKGFKRYRIRRLLTKAEIEYDKYAGEKQVAFNQLQGDAATGEVLQGPSEGP